jgi:hypothetical protein
MWALKDLSSRVFRTPCPDQSMRMVNDGFPARIGYGFEMVDGRDTGHFTEIRHQSKIYTESIQWVFTQIFGDLTSMQTLALYRRLLVRDRLRKSIATEPKKRRPGSRDVFSASHGILARAGARAAAQGEDT